MALTPEQIAAITQIANGGAAPSAPAAADPTRVTPQITAAPSAPASSPAGLGDMSAVIAAAAAAGAQAAIAALGHGAAPAAPAQRPTYQRPLGPPASDGGGPAAPARNLDGVSLFSMNEADRAHVIKARGLQWYRDELLRQSKSVTVKLR